MPRNFETDLIEQELRVASSRQVEDLDPSDAVIGRLNRAANDRAES